MNQASVTPAPHILILLLANPDPSTQQTSARFLIDLLQSPDPLTRWGTVSYLLHTPMHFYLDSLLDRLQEQDQPDTLREAASRMITLRACPSALTAIYILRVFARLRFLLYLVADLHRCPPQVYA